MEHALERRGVLYGLRMLGRRLRNVVIVLYGIYVMCDAVSALDMLRMVVGERLPPIVQHGDDEGDEGDEGDETDETDQAVSVMIDDGGYDDDAECILKVDDGEDVFAQAGMHAIMWNLTALDQNGSPSP